MTDNPFTSALSEGLRWLQSGLSGMANVPPSYPGRDEINLARQSQFGLPWDQPYNQGQQATVAPESIATVMNDPEMRAGTINATPPGPRVADAMTATALLANRAPLAGLGWDPRRTVMNDSPFRLGGAVGEYRAGPDRTYVDENTSQGTGVHEAVHRGLEKLRQAGSATARGLGRTEEEAIARYIEQSLMGRPQPTNIRDPAYYQGRGVWEENPKVLEMVGTLNREAAALAAKQRPRGPR